MAPDHLRFAAIVLALVSVVLFALVAKKWSAGRPGRRSDDNTPSGWQGNVLLFLISIGLVGSVLAVAGMAGWNRDQALWVGLGTFFGFMTLLRPWWFWEDYRARWLRKLIGNEATMVVYLAIAGIMVWIGLHTDWTFGRR